MKNQYFFIVLALGFISLNIGCSNPERERYEAFVKEGEQLTKTYCTTCHKETPAPLLDKKTWVFKVLPQMGPRLGMHNYKSLYYQRINPTLVPKLPAMTQEQWEKIVDYFYIVSPDSLPKQEFDREPEENCKTFSVGTFTDDIASSSIITMLKIDTLHRLVFAGDAMNSTLFKFDYDGNLLDTMRLPSPPTEMMIGANHFDMTLAGILHPNNEDKGQIMQYDHSTDKKFDPEANTLMLESLYRPVTSIAFDFNYDGLQDYLVGEYGNDIGRLSLYFANGEGGFRPYILENVPGTIMLKIHDFNKDGFMDIAALFAQGDEKIMIFYNDGEGNFRGNFSLAARFPAVYGSMYFDLQDFNHDGFMDIIYVNGDNFDFSQILKPYHGIRLLENDGNNNFEEKYFFPVYGAGRTVVFDFDADGDLDILIASNFADMENNPERGITYLESIGNYDFIPYTFQEAALNQWNTMQMADLDDDGDQDVIIGAMNLANVLKMQELGDGDENALKKTALIVLKNNTL